MKRIGKATAVVSLGALLAGFGFGGQIAPKPLSGTVTLSGAWALYPMAVRWAEEFKKVHPGVRIDVQAGGAGKGMADALMGMADFGMVSREINLRRPRRAPSLSP